MIHTPFVRNPYNYDVDEASDESGTDCSTGGPSMCQQHFRDESDINEIVKRFGLTGELPTGVKVPRYGDFTEVSDYQSALNLVIAADDAFMEMPADVRARFRNDPGAFVDFCSDPANQEEAIKLGVAVRRAEAAPLQAASSSPEGNQTPGT